MLLLLIGALALALFSVSAPSAQSSSGKPHAPLVIANGNSVTLSWRLPVSPRPLNVVIYRGEVGGPLSRIGTVEAERRSFTDSNVSAGQSYDYAVAHDQRGLPLSAMSAPVSVSVGVTDRIVFRGGSISRGVFDVTVYAENRKFVETFVAAPGEAVGDLRRVGGIEKALDFRLGCKVMALRLEIAPGKSKERQPIQDSAGRALTDLAGRPIELTLPAKSEERERLVAELEVSGGRRITLQEGEGFSPVMSAQMPLAR
ncbi:MAG: fibronectin type III domain-containing protein [Planctomycetes bacterium]|nr:fibronectin type III domain-containing protein [Planctomycetota bacterium]